MRYSRASKMSCRVGKIYLKFTECRGPQMMPRVCRVAWAIVEVVDLREQNGHPAKLLKML